MTAAGAPPGRLVRCPTCGHAARYAADNPWRPFCSERCRSIDLGAWADEAYRLPSPASQAEGAEPAEGASAARAPDRPPDLPH